MKRKMLYVLAGLVALVVLLVGAVTVAGMLIPSQHSFSRAMPLSQSPEAVWEVVRDYARQPEWRKDVRSVERIGGHAGGASQDQWKITTTHGSSGFFRTATSEPPRLLVLEHTGEDGVVMVIWRMAIAPAGGGCLITIHESGDFGNPYTRFMVRYLLGQTKFVDDYLGYLAAKFGEPAAIE